MTARSTGPGFQRGGGVESREITEQNGNRYIAQLSRALNIPESASKAAGQVFKLAVGLNFIQGRRTKTVAAICLYVACRRQDGNTIMLIDFADVLMINVFKLGRTYKALLDELRLGGNIFIMNPIDPESLIYRFAKQLEFGSSMMQVASEAVRIVQRMNRDWMITGRRPAGICGAALILAARMNNFRRTVREVVYVVKVTELTIHQRLNEFKATESGDLTVDQFRSVDLETSHDPPSFSHSKDPRRLNNKGKKRKAPETAAEIEDGEEPDQSPPASKRPRRVDADGFAVPDIPIDPAILGLEMQDPLSSTDGNATAESNSGVAGVVEKSTNQRKGSKRARLPEPTEAELASESALEDEMTALLSSGSSLVASAEAPRTASASSSKGQIVPDKRPNKPVPDSEEIDPTEFDSDPEVRYWLLSPAESVITRVHPGRGNQADAREKRVQQEDQLFVAGIDVRRRRHRSEAPRQRARECSKSEPQPERRSKRAEFQRCVGPWILGYIPEAEPRAHPVPGDEDDYDEDEDEDEDEDDDDDRIEAAFAGNYYDEGSDGGYDDDY
ncbi:transcription factor tfiiib complex subunit brf1 [Coccidioides immitis RMSCC 3703]|uniref:B-related factor 1 n=1 Tax=Coccidioides immitis RMSCC 3703 TaxID=454286 RepID=A0A0J8QHD2_COCIT|nr:transcription factor tfiiib complex subunit brf1 [Coccidioides immitis RMSCC 3703]